jgi:hypothetical protein
MEIIHLPTREDGGGKISVHAVGSKEIRYTFNVLRGGPSHCCPEQVILDCADALRAGEYRITTKEHEKYFYYRNTGTIPGEWVSPYISLMDRMTGYTGPLPELNITAWLPKQIMHTHIVQDLKLLSNGGIEYVCITNTGKDGWNGKTAKEHAAKMADEYIKKDFGDVPFTPEYIPANCLINSAHFVYNPAYGRHKGPRPEAKQVWFFNNLFNWWRENLANDAQKSMLAQDEERHKKADLRPSFVMEYGHPNYQGLRLADGSHVSWDVFKKSA